METVILIVLIIYGAAIVSLQIQVSDLNRRMTKLEDKETYHAQSKTKQL